MFIAAAMIFLSCENPVSDNSGNGTDSGRDASSLSSYSRSTKIICEKGLAVPGFIDGRRHSSYALNSPADPSMEDGRYDHRHEWRKGLNGKPKILYTSPSASGSDWDEVVMIMAGVTSVNNGSTANYSMVRDLRGTGAAEDIFSGTESRRFDSFPLGDSSGTMTAVLNDYPEEPDLSELEGAYYFSAVVSEGIGLEARNEFLSLTNGDNTMLRDNAVFLNGSGLKAQDYEAMAQANSSLVWTPRSDLFLYGNTAQVTAFAGYGGNIALGTVWNLTGSYNLLLELKRAKSYNETYLNGYFSDQELIDLATINGARAFHAEDYIGSFQVGKLADFTLFNLDEDNPYDSVFEADQEDVLLVARGGEALYGDTYLIDYLTSSLDGSETFQVNGATKRLFLERETGQTKSDLEIAASSETHTPLVFDKDAIDEDVIPCRDGEYDGSVTSGDRDGDGIENGLDSEPNIFNPVRPVDEGVQPRVIAD